MDKSLLLGLPILLCSFRVQSTAYLLINIFCLLRSPYSPVPTIEIIQCRMCHFQFPRESCFKGRGICTATMEESCITGKIFKNDGFPWMTFMGCLKNCANVYHLRWGAYLVNFRCCRSHDLCNEPVATVAPTLPPIQIW
ncbi:prostate and testis expressed protein 1 [Phyllostomus discolor]|uniref:Prostate and testis expressed protein 1 n=1 Tax=Phyllostomus discolor TaxID=89673 RepID=A0A7E6CRE0_9CHIR|nr:prostate and testis expressed protein 1 [Phyllostomus discolor]